MPDELPKKRSRAPINAIRLLNKLREKAGLPKATTKPKVVKPVVVKISKAEKESLAQTVWEELYPNILTDKELLVTEAMNKAVVQEYSRRLKALLKK